jgi:homoserine O-acetyltransferase
LLESVVDHDVAIGDVTLASGITLANVVARVTIYGQPDPDGANVVFAPHALTGSSRVAEWWGGIAGPGALFDPAQWCVVGINTAAPARNRSHPTVAATDRAFRSSPSKTWSTSNGARCSNSVSRNSPS